MEVSNVHDALKRAQAKDRADSALINTSIRINPLSRTLAEDICKAHGITLSQFIRECVDLLILDYVGQRQAANIGIDDGR